MNPQGADVDARCAGEKNFLDLGLKQNPFGLDIGASAMGGGVSLLVEGTELISDGLKSKQVWKRIPEHERLKLHAAVSFGLPVDFAGKVISMSSRNANRIIKSVTAKRRQERDRIEAMPSESRALVKAQRSHDY